MGNAQILGDRSGGVDAVVRTKAATARKLAIGLWAATLAFAVWQFWPVFTPVTGRDFTIFWLSGKATLAGHPELPFNHDAFAAYSKAVIGKVQAPLPYPPHVLLIFAPLGLFALTPAFFIWNFFSAGLFAWAARPYVRTIPAALAVFTPAGIQSLIFGQTGLFIGGLWLLAFRGHPWAVGLLTLKPHVGWMAAFTLKDRNKFLAACIAAAILILIAGLLFPSAFLAYPETLQRHASLIDNKKYGIWYFHVVSPRFTYGLIGWLLFALAAAILVWKRFNVFTAATATLLIAPYALHYDMTVACLGMILALFRERRPVFQFLLIFGFVTPYLTMWGSSWIAPPLILGALYAQVFGEFDETGKPARSDSMRPIAVAANREVTGVT